MWKWRLVWTLFHTVLPHKVKNDRRYYVQGAQIPWPGLMSTGLLWTWWQNGCLYGSGFLFFIFGWSHHLIKTSEPHFHLSASSEIKLVTFRGNNAGRKWMMREPVSTELSVIQSPVTFSWPFSPWHQSGCAVCHQHRLSSMSVPVWMEITIHSP